MMIECVCCGWQGSDTALVMPYSDSPASCPSCLSDDFIDLNDTFVKVEPIQTYMEINDA